MASRLSQFVRQEIPPPIRPAPPQPVLAADEDETGLAVLSGGSGRLIDLAFTYSASFSRSRSHETRRKVDEVRVYQKEDDGTVNHENFVDLQVPTQIEMAETTPMDQGGIMPAEYDPAATNIYTNHMFRYRTQEETDNIEIRFRNRWIKNPNLPPGMASGPGSPGGGAP